MPGKKNGSKDSAVVPFHVTLNGAVSSNVFSVALQPSATFGTRLLAEADTWAHFRVRKLRFRILPTVAARQLCGYVGGVQDTTPATVAAISELIPSCIFGALQTVPTEWVTVPAADLAGAFPWYKSVAGAADATEEAPGVICIQSNGATDSFLVEVRGVFEFKTAVGTGNTPAAMARLVAAAAERRELAARVARDNLMRVLATPPSLLPGRNP